MATTCRGRRTSRLTMTFAAALLTVGLGACASSTPTTPSATASSSMPTASGTPSASGQAGNGGSTTLTGTIEAGVESGCLVLTDKAGAVLANLQGLDPKTVTYEVEVDVTGKFEDMMTTCMQGKPFSVTSVQPR